MITKRPDLIIIDEMEPIMDKKLLATMLAASASIPISSDRVLDYKSKENRQSDFFGENRQERRERRTVHNKGISFTSGHKYQSKTKRIRKIAKASRQYNRRLAKGMRVK